MKLKAAMVGAVLWPAFVGAALGDGILFTLIDPDALAWFGTHETLSRQGVYTIGFFLLWFLIAGSSFISIWLYDGTVEERTRAGASRRDHAGE